jgi:hypothetical protein
MAAPIAVLELYRRDDGRWEVAVPDVRSSHDVDTLPSLEGLARAEAEVLVAGERRTLTVYEHDGDHYVTWADALG